MTESSPLTHIQPLEGAILGSCGQPVPNTIAKVRAYTVYAEGVLTPVSKLFPPISNPNDVQRPK